MALTTATVTFDIADQLGNDFDPRRTKVWLTTNVPGDTVIDKAANKIRLGSGNVTLNADGTGSIVVWVPGADANPASWQTTIHVDYPDRNAANRGRGVKSFGPFTITANADLADLVAEMPVQPEYASEVFTRLDALEANSGVSDALDVLTAQVNGYNMLGNVSGAVAVQPVGTQVMNVTGPTTITIAGGHANGESFTLLIRSGGDDVTWANSIGFDAGDPEGDIISVTFMKVEGYWTSLAGAGGGGEVVVPVTDPPTQPGAVTVDPTADGYNLSWVASTVASGYEGLVDGGTYSDYGSNLTEAVTGLSPGSSHSGAIRAYNSLGAKSTPRTWGPASVDTMGLREQILALDGLQFFIAGDDAPGASLPTVNGPLSSGWAKEGANAAAMSGQAPLLSTASYSMRFLHNQVLRLLDDSALDPFTQVTILGIAHADWTGGHGASRFLSRRNGNPEVGFGTGVESYATIAPQDTILFAWRSIPGEGVYDGEFQSATRGLKTGNAAWGFPQGGSSGGNGLRIGGSIFGDENVENIGARFNYLSYVNRAIDDAELLSLQNAFLSEVL